MSLPSLNRLRKLRHIIVSLRRGWLRTFKGVHVDPRSSVSLSSRFLAGRAGDIAVGPETLIAFKTLLYSYDPVSGRHRPIRIGRRCFIGGGSVIGPGVEIGDGSIVGAGSVVLESVPPRSIVGGNPARLLRSNVDVGPYGRLKGADQNIRQMWR